MAPKRSKPSSSAGSKKKGKGKKTRSPIQQDKPDHPDDIFPMVLTSATQELFGCRTDQDVTRESPYKLLKKDDIIQDMKTRAAVCDFSPVKQIVLDYPEEEMLLVFDRDFTYGHSFYLVLTPEAKDRILRPPEPEIPEVVENEVSKTPEPKPWISLGSEQEIEEESVKETRKNMRYKLSRERRKFGKRVCFSDSNHADAKDSFRECVSYKDKRFCIKQMQKDCGMQALPMLQSSSAQTQRRFQKNSVTQYKSRELCEEELESILQADSLKNFYISLTPRILQALQQEIIIDFSDDLKVQGKGSKASDREGQTEGSEKDSEGLVLDQSFAYPKYTKDKKISSISWHPTIPSVIAVALTEKKKEQLDKSGMFVVRPAFIVFYSFSDPCPQLLLECPDDILAFDFCPSDPNIIVGGCVNGQVVLWDISAHVTNLQELGDNKENEPPVMHYCAVSAIENSHKAPITDVQWLPQTFEVTRTGLPVENKYNISVQVVTCSLDCTVLFWDVRMPELLSQSLPDNTSNVDQKNLMIPGSIPNTFKHLDQTWQPLFRVSLPKIDSSGEYAPLKFSLEHYAGNSNTGKPNKKDSPQVIPDYSQLRAPSGKTLMTLEDVNTKFYIVTVDGEIVYTDWKLVKEDSGRLYSARPLFCFNAHHWLVNMMQRSPFFSDIILTTGGWNFAIWKEGAMDGPIVSRNSEQVCTAGCWSLSRPAVFFIGKEDGSMEVWDLLENTSEPVQVYAHITSAKITCIKPWTVAPKQHFLAVTYDHGMVSIFKIQKTFYTPSKKERLNVKKYFEQEVNRLKDYLMREDLWAKQKKEAEDHKKEMETEKPLKLLQDTEEEDMEYRKYLMLEESILKGMGL